MNVRTGGSHSILRLVFPAFAVAFCILPPSISVGPARAQDTRESVDELCETLLSEKLRKDPHEQSKREVALHKLARRDSVAAAKCLVQVLNDPFEHIRQEAVYWMQDKTANQQVVDWLVNRGLRVSDPVVRKNVVRVLARLGPEDLTSHLKPLATDDAVDVRLAVIRALRRYEPEQVPSYLPELAGNQNKRIAAEAIRTMGTIDDDRVSSYLRNTIRSLEGRVLAEAALTLGRHAPDGAVGMLKTLLEHNDWRVRTMALRGMLAAERTRGGDKFQGTLKSAESALEDPNWHVRAAAVDALVRTWQKEAIPILLDGFERAEGRLKLDYMRALQSMTGQDLKWNPLNWKSWWSQHKEDVELGEQPENWRKGEDITPDEEETGGFFGVPMLSRRVMFVMDFSGGMSSEVTGGEYEGKTKLEIAKNELRDTVKKLSEEHKFNILIYRYSSTFPPKTRILSPVSKGKKLAPAENQVKSAAVEWVMKQRAGGWGAFYESFRAATRSPAVDTIVFLSDGKPTRGRFAGTSAIMEDRFFQELQEMNRYRQVMIHTVLTGKEAGGTDADYLKRVADLTGGIFQKY